MQGETILCIAPRMWHSLWRDTQPIMWRMAKQNRVLFFEPGRNPDRRHSVEMWRNLPNFFSLKAHAVHENLILIPTPSRLPVMRRRLPSALLQITTPLVTWTNARVLIRHIRQAVKVYDVHEPILWLYSPYQCDLIGEFNEKLTCYYNYDEFSNYVSNARIKELMRNLDDRICKSVDIVFATGRAQWEQRKKLNPNSFFVPNAVDFDLFHRALDPDTPTPQDVADLPKPIIGYVGWIGYQIDVDLLLRVAETYHDGSVLLVGPDNLPNSPSRDRLYAMPNVHFVGQKEQKCLPGYLKALDVALIPYVLAGYTLTAYPLKLHEYLAAGRAIVATQLPELKPFDQVVRIAETSSKYIYEIGQALSENSPQAIEARVEIARENTWDCRVEEIYHVLQDHLANGYKEMAP